MKKLLFLSFATMFALAACGPDGNNGIDPGTEPPAVVEPPKDSDEPVTPKEAIDENFGTITDPVEYAPGDVVVLAVDYTTNTFLGGYTLPVATGGEFALRADYRSPGDFGDVTVYDKVSDTKLFAGDIVWMGSGKMTYPEAMHAPGSFEISVRNAMDYGRLPEFTEWSYSGGDYTSPHDLGPVEDAVLGIDVAWQAVRNAPGVPIYATLYARSVGMGNPAEWYWLIFIRG